MKKVILQLFFLLMVTTVFAQADVVVSIDITANPDITNVMFKGTPTGWADIQGYDDGTNGDATAGDNIWTATFAAVACDGTMHEWGATDQDGVWLLAAGVPNQMFVVDAACDITGDQLYTIPTVGGAIMVKLTVVDLNMDIDGVSFKGAYGGWTDVDGFDDGTNGDDVANDGIWTLVVEANMPEAGADPIDYEWGANRTDCASPAWIIVGGNRIFTVDDAGTVTGQTDFEVALTGQQFNVTFRVYMGNEIISSNGVSVTGEFETCPWSFGDVPLTAHPTIPDVYQATYPISPSVVRWKFANEIGENEGGTPSATVFQDNGCGVDNNLGGSNRQVDLTSMSTDFELPIYVYNTCDIYTFVSTDEALDLAYFDLTPNPANEQVVVTFSNDQNDSFEMTITDVTGRLVQQMNVTGNQVAVSVADMMAGMYFVTLSDDMGAAVSKKLVVR